MRAASQGITLTRASNVAFVELDWTPARHDQAEDRLHRIGQDSAVTAWYLLAPETIDETMATLLERKRTVIDAVTEGDVREEGPMVDQVVRELRGAAVPAPARGGMSTSYVHGYDPRESERLADQAGTLVELLHSDTSYPAGSTVLEAGCGVGAQTVTLAQRSPGARFTSVDVSEESLAEAERKAGEAGIENVEFRQADLFDLPFEAESFDHVFVCFVLEHLSQPVEALETLRGLLKPGGTITVIEGDHGSAYFHPEAPSRRPRSSA